MKTVLAAAALLAIAAAPARADAPSIAYDEALDCAAFTNLAGQAMLSGDNVTDANKATAETMQKRTVALLSYASIMFNKDIDAIKTDFGAHNDALVDDFSHNSADQDAVNAWIRKHGERCIPMGDAVAEAIDSLKEKK